MSPSSPSLLLLGVGQFGKDTIRALGSALIDEYGDTSARRSRIIAAFNLHHLDSRSESSRWSLEDLSAIFTQGNPQLVPRAEEFTEAEEVILENLASVIAARSRGTPPHDTEPPTDVDLRLFLDIEAPISAGVFTDLVSHLRSAYPASSSSPLVLYGRMPGLRSVESDLPINCHFLLREIHALTLGAPPLSPSATPTLPLVQLCHIVTGNDQCHDSQLMANLLLCGPLAEHAGSEQVDQLETYLSTAVLSDTPGFLGGSGRSRRFASVAITRIHYPKHKVKRYLTSALLAAACRGLRYVNWRPDSGFLATPRPGVDWSHTVRDTEYLLSWRLSSEHLQLQLPIDSSDCGPRPFQDEWNGIVHRGIGEWEAETRKRTESGQEPPALFPFMERACARAFRHQFRALGVPEVFSAARSESSRLSRLLVENLTDWAVRQLREGSMGTADLLAWADALLAHLQDRRSDHPRQLQSLTNEQSRADARVKELSDIDGKLPNVSWLSDWLPGTTVRADRARLRSEVTDAYLAKYVALTRIEALEWEAHLIGDLIGQIHDTLRCRLEEVDGLLAAIDRQSQRPQLAFHNDGRSDWHWDGPDLVIFPAGTIRRATAALAEDEHLLVSHLLPRLRAALLAPANEPQQGVEPDSLLVVTLWHECERAVESWENGREPSERVCDIGVGDILSKVLSSPRDLRDLVQSIGQNAAQLAELDHTQRSLLRHGPDAHVRSLVLAPVAPSAQSRVDDMITLLRESVGLVHAQDCSVQRIRSDRTSIVLMTSAHRLPLRFFRALRPLCGVRTSDHDWKSSLYPPSEPELAALTLRSLRTAHEQGLVDIVDTDRGRAFRIPSSALGDGTPYILFPVDQDPAPFIDEAYAVRLLSAIAALYQETRFPLTEG